MPTLSLPEIAAGLIVAGSAAAGVASFSSTSRAATEAASNRLTSVEWTPTTLTSNAGETVPADTARIAISGGVGSSQTVSLPVLRLRAAGSGRGTPIVFVAGGPGNSGLTSARGDLFPVLLALRAQGDVYVYDQRGTGRALPSLQINGNLELPTDVGLESSATAKRLEEIARSVANTLSERGIDPALYTSEVSAGDLDAIRVALGVERWIVWGHSYGSHLALAYLRRFESRVDRLLLSGVNGVDQRRRLPSDGDRFIASVDSALRTNRAFAGNWPGFANRLRTVLDRLRTTPAVVNISGQRVHVGAAEVQTLIAVSSGDRAFVSALPLFVADLEAGRFEVVAQQIVTALKRRPIGTAMTYLMDLASGVPMARQQLIDAERSRAILGDALNFPFNVPQFVAQLPHSTLPDGYRIPVRSTVPTQFLSGSLDGRTSVNDAEAVRAGFPNSGHLVVLGASHASYAASPAVLEQVVGFVADGRPRSQRLSVDPEWRAPDESAQVRQLLQIALAEGAPVAATQLRRMAVDTTVIVTPFLPGNLFFALRQAGQPQAAVAILDVGLELFPKNVFLLLRQSEIASARRDLAKAREYAARAFTADSLNLAARARYLETRTR
jgi:pimeloyl-ACP methyl ester carboxylesterase